MSDIPLTNCWSVSNKQPLPDCQTRCLRCDKPYSAFLFDNSDGTQHVQVTCCECCDGYQYAWCLPVDRPVVQLILICLTVLQTEAGIRNGLSYHEGSTGIVRFPYVADFDLRILDPQE